MIDTGKYEGHTENKWVWYEFNDGDWILCPLHDDVKPDPNDLWWGVDEETGEPLETHAALNWDERILNLASDCMTGNNITTPLESFTYCSHSRERLPRKQADMNLIADAPLLLAEVKRLRGLLKITAQSYLDDVRSEDMLGEVSVKKEYEKCQEIADVLGVSIVSGHTLHADGYDMVSEFGRYFVYLDEDGEMVMMND